MNSPFTRDWADAAIGIDLATPQVGRRGGVFFCRAATSRIFVNTACSQVVLGAGLFNHDTCDDVTSTSLGGVVTATNRNFVDIFLIMALMGPAEALGGTCSKSRDVLSRPYWAAVRDAKLFILSEDMSGKLSGRSFSELVRQMSIRTTHMAQYCHRDPSCESSDG